MSNRTRVAALAAVVAFALAACTSTVVRTSGTTRLPAPRVSTPKYGATAKVQRGDTLYGIAFRNGIDVRDLAAWNGISAPYTIYPGQNLRLYPRGGDTTTAVRTPSTQSRPAAATIAPSRPSGAATTGTTARPATPQVVPPVVQPPVPAAPVASDIRWRWPAEGALLTRFVAGEPTKQGIDISGDGGVPVNAAADGVVVYSGSGLVGYGELIIIKHNDAWLSAYGHNRARMVNEGALVKAGQQIAVMGRTGAPRDMLHFEIRYNGKPVDPLLYLPKR
jgi:lipoprotein NlpD